MATYVKRPGFAREVADGTTVVTAQEQGAIDGYGYSLNTGTIALTSASESACFYIKYTGTTSFVVTALEVGVGKLGVSTDPALVKVTRGPTGGTIVSTATAGDQNQNQDFSSSNTLSSAFYKGAEAETLTGGNTIAQFFQAQSGRLLVPVIFVLDPQDTIGISVTPNDDGTGGNVYVALLGYEKEA